MVIPCNYYKIPQDLKKYIIKGRPVPLARARHGNKKTWDSQKAEKLYYGCIIQQQHIPHPIITQPLILYIDFYFKPPNNKQNHQPHHYRPDLSNLIKFVEDVCSGIIYKDDCLVSACYAHKVYDQNQRTEFIIQRWDENNGKKNKKRQKEF